MKDSYSVSELAFIFDKTHATIYNWMSDGKLPKDRPVTADDVRPLLEEETAAAEDKWRRFRNIREREAAPVS